MATIADSLKRAILESGVTRYRISQDTGIAESILCRFMQGKDISLTNAQILADYFGYKLIQTTPKTKRR